MNKENYKENILLALFIAIIALMSYVPFLGYITTGAISITTLHIPLIIGSIALGKNKGAIIGLAFGIFNLIKAYTSGTPEALIFINPLISVLPRFLAGYLIGLFFEYINSFENKKGAIATERLFYTLAILVIGFLTFIFEIIGLIISSIITVLVYILVKKFSGKFKLSIILISIVGTLIHTTLVLTAIGTFGGGSLVNLGENIILVFQSIVLINVVFEVLISSIITPIIISTLVKARFIKLG